MKIQLKKNPVLRAHPDGDDDPATPTKPPELHAAVRKLMTVQWLHTPGGAPKAELTPPFAAALDAARQAAPPPPSPPSRTRDAAASP